MDGKHDLESDKTTIRRWEERFWNESDFAETPALITAGFVCHRPGGLEDIAGREAHDAWVAGVRDANPGFRVEINHLIAKGDKVASSWWGTGPGMHVYRMEDGKIAEMWTVVALPAP